MIVKFTKEILDNIERYDNDVKNANDLIRSETEFINSEEVRLKRLNKKLEIGLINEKKEKVIVDIATLKTELKFELLNGKKNGRAMNALKVSFPKLHKAILDERDKRVVMNTYISAKLGFNYQMMNTTTLIGIIKGMIAYMVTDCLGQVELLTEQQIKKIKAKYDYEEEIEDLEVKPDDVLLSSIEEIKVGSKIQLLANGLQHEEKLKKGMILEVTEVFRFHLLAKDALNRTWGFSKNKCYKYIKLWKRQ